MNIEGKRRVESDVQFFDRINNELSSYQGLMRGGFALLQPLCGQLNKMVMAKRGIFAVTLMLPAVCIVYNIWNAVYKSVLMVCLSRSLYTCFFTLNFAAGRIIWYAVPEDVKIIAYPIVVDLLPAASKGVGAILTLFLQLANVDAGNTQLTVLMIIGSMMWMIVIHIPLRKGYIIHLSNSIATRSVGDDTLTFDVSNKQIVEYVTDFIMLGDKHQRLFILNLLKAVSLDQFHDCLAHIYALKPDIDVMVKLIEVRLLLTHQLTHELLLRSSPPIPPACNEFVGHAVAGCAPGRERNLQRRSVTINSRPARRASHCRCIAVGDRDS